MIPFGPTSLYASALLPEAERMRRIGAWVCRAALVEIPDGDFAAPIPMEVSDCATPKPDRVLAYLRKVGVASPREIRVSLGLGRSAAYRSLRALVRSGAARPQGQTKSQLYLPALATVDPVRN